MDYLPPINRQCNTKSSGEATVATPPADVETVSIRKITALRDVLADVSLSAAQKIDRIHEIAERADV